MPGYCICAFSRMRDMLLYLVTAALMGGIHSPSSFSMPSNSFFCSAANAVRWSEIHPACLLCAHLARNSSNKVRAVVYAAAVKLVVGDSARGLRHPAKI